MCEIHTAYIWKQKCRESDNRCHKDNPWGQRWQSCHTDSSPQWRLLLICSGYVFRISRIFNLLRWAWNTVLEQLIDMRNIALRNTHNTMRKHPSSGRAGTRWHQAEKSWQLIPVSYLPTRTIRQRMFPVYPIPFCAQITQLSIIHRQLKINTSLWSRGRSR